MVAAASWPLSWDHPSWSLLAGGEQSAWSANLVWRLRVARSANLTDLDLNGNDLVSIPVEIGNLANLVNLNLSYNELVSIPSQVGDLAPTLAMLDLRDNNLAGDQTSMLRRSLWPTT